MRLGLLLLMTVVAHAQETPDPAAALEAMRASAGYRNAVRQVIDRYEGSLSTHCGSIEITGRPPAIVLAPLELDDQGTIRSGAWHETDDGTACGEKRRYNTLVVVHEGRPQLMAEYPGESAASPLLQRDGVKYAAIAANAGADCGAEVLETSLANGRPTRLPSGLLTPWDERWLVRSCGKKYLVTMHFIPDKTGTTIHTSASETLKQ